VKWVVVANNRNCYQWHGSKSSIIPRDITTAVWRRIYQNCFLWLTKLKSRVPEGTTISCCHADGPTSSAFFFLSFFLSRISSKTDRPYVKRLAKAINSIFENNHPSGNSRTAYCRWIFHLLRLSPILSKESRLLFSIKRKVMDLFLLHLHTNISCTINRMDIVSQLHISSSVSVQRYREKLLPKQLSSMFGMWKHNSLSWNEISQM